jgi:FlaA1/EpsC-like NDP-sugar epimerase
MIEAGEKAFANNAMRRADSAFHAKALRQVPFCECLPPCLFA